MMRVLTWAGRERSYLLRLPPTYRPTVPIPLILAFHGATSNAKLMEQFCGLTEFAASVGCAVAYPNGTGNLPNVLTWNGGACCGYAKTHAVDDVGFVNALLEDVATIVNVEAARVYAAGMSNGAHLAYRLAAELTHRFAAIACVAGTMGIDNPTPSRPISVLQIHGTDDQFSPFAGGVGSLSTYGVPAKSVRDTVLLWGKLNGCPVTAKKEQETPLVADGTWIEREKFSPGLKGVEVELIVVHQGGHTWPGRPPLPAKLGVSTANLDANRAIWEFFCRHHNPHALPRLRSR